MIERVQLDTFRDRLLTLKDELEQLSSTGKQASNTVVLDQSKVGRLSRMDAMQAQQMAQETERRRQLQLQKIETALSRITTDEYGYCFVCGEEIGEARLNFDPASTRCINCAEV
jgi:DnaK suppressor protein